MSRSKILELYSKKYLKKRAYKDLNNAVLNYKGIDLKRFYFYNYPSIFFKEYLSKFAYIKVG